MATYFKVEYEVYNRFTRRNRTTSRDFLDRSNADNFADFKKGTVVECIIEDEKFAERKEYREFEDCAWVDYNIQSRSSGWFHPDYATLEEMTAAINSIRSGNDYDDKSWLLQCEFQRCSHYYSCDTHRGEIDISNLNL